MSLKLVDFDPLDYLRTEEAVSGFIKAAKAGGDEEHVARAQQIAETARQRNACKAHHIVAKGAVFSCHYSFKRNSLPWVRPIPAQTPYPECAFAQ